MENISLLVVTHFSKVRIVLNEIVIGVNIIFIGVSFYSWNFCLLLFRTWFLFLCESLCCFVGILLEQGAQESGLASLQAGADGLSRATASGH